MPADTPVANVMECQAFGAKVIKLNGLISDCGKYVAERKDREGWYDVSTLKEPYRIEGKKTMGYELWEQFGGKLPDVILYPTGGGVGLIGMCKAFDEMQEMGWIGRERPGMVAVQAEGCVPSSGRGKLTRVRRSFSKMPPQSHPVCAFRGRWAT